VRSARPAARFGDRVATMKGKVISQPVG